MNWGGQTAVGVLGASAVAAYVIGDMGTTTTVLGSADGSGWGGGGATLGGGGAAVGDTGGSSGSGCESDQTLTAAWLVDADHYLTVTSTVTSMTTSDSRLSVGQYLWTYQIDNPLFADSEESPIEVTTFDLPTPLAATVGNIVSNGWTVTTDAGSVYFSSGSGGTPIEPGQSMTVSFTTSAADVAKTTTTGSSRRAAGLGGFSGPVIVPIITPISPPVVPPPPPPPPPPPQQPPQVLIEPNGGGVTLRVAKWQNAFDPAPGGTTVVVRGPDAGTNWDFIDRDPDRFNVWVYDKAKWDANVGHLQAKISTTNVVGFTENNDPATPVDLVRVTSGPPGKSSTGWYWSDSQMLVSNQKDDGFAAGNTTGYYLGADEAAPGGNALPKNGHTWLVSDRTHRVALRGTVKAEYTSATGVTAAATAPVPVTKNVKVHTTILKLASGAPVITETDANIALHRGNEQYAQVGILLIPNYQTKDQPTGVNLGNGLDEYPGVTPAGVIVMTNEEKALLGAAGLRTAATDDVELYFVNYLSDGNRGESFWAAGVPDQKYADSVVISKDASTLFTIPHEIGHLLLNTGNHFTGSFWPANLMRSGTSTTDGVVESKRLAPSQQTSMYSSRPNLLTGP